jgi:hypothetical protein
MSASASASSVAGVDVCFTRDGRFYLNIYSRKTFVYWFFCFSYIVTCGPDGYVRIYEIKNNKFRHIYCSQQCHCVVAHVSSFKDISKFRDNL